MQHFIYFAPDTDLSDLLQHPLWNAHQVSITQFIGFCPGSLMGMIECTSQQPLDADGKEDVYDLPGYTTDMMNVG